ncbi:MAG TPA: hypothetical protein VMN81_12250 [Vicinamibacterales bacterium]|nr:hypothetical protein [Vicinamibacterales bacterium]
MTRENAEKTANIILGVAGAAAALLMLRNSVLRRTALKLGRTAIVAGGPWLAREATAAWQRSRGA